MATRILVFRHAEKPDDPNDPDLTPAGRDRAKALATFIPKTFGTVDAIFAASVSKHSARPYETVKPLSKKTGVPIDATYADQDYAALAKDLTTDKTIEGKLIVVCWHHGNIPNLLHALNAPDGDYPDPWKRDVFDLIVALTFVGTAAPTVQTIKEDFAP